MITIATPATTPATTRTTTTTTNEKQQQQVGNTNGGAGGAGNKGEERAGDKFSPVDAEFHADAQMAAAWFEGEGVGNEVREG